jgi:alanine-glyoxylate transaminase/serine-glyoxylate transaminase/serine-pyruvate transaminase
MEDVATRLEADVDTLEFEWGTPLHVADVQAKLQKKNTLRSFQGLSPHRAH